MQDHTAITQRFTQVPGVLDERGRRAVAAAEALALVWGGMTAVSRATALSLKAVARGIRDLQEEPLPAGRIRRPGAGRKRATEHGPTLLADLERVVEPVTRGDPESPLRWASKSGRKLAAALRQQGHQVSHQLVSELLHAPGYRLQANRRTREGADHPDRDAQFEHINATTAAFMEGGDPVISGQPCRALLAERSAAVADWMARRCLCVIHARRAAHLLLYAPVVKGDAQGAGAGAVHSASRRVMPSGRGGHDGSAETCLVVASVRSAPTSGGWAYHRDVGAQAVDDNPSDPADELRLLRDPV